MCWCAASAVKGERSESRVTGVPERSEERTALDGFATPGDWRATGGLVGDLLPKTLCLLEYVVGKQLGSPENLHPKKPIVGIEVENDRSFLNLDIAHVGVRDLGCANIRHEIDECCVSVGIEGDSQGQSHP